MELDKANNAIIEFVNRAKHKIDACIDSTAPSCKKCDWCPINKRETKSQKKRSGI